MYKNAILWAVIFSTVLFMSISGAADIAGFQKVAVLRISFKTDNNSGTTGNGQFLLAADYDTCGSYTIDPPPHNKSYFIAQLKAMDNYFRNVSNGHFGIDLDNSDVLPVGINASYQLPDSMAYYHGYEEDDIHELRLTELFRDAVELAYQTDQIDFTGYDLVILFHAGIGQDFELPYLDPTPEDIPSTYVDPAMLQTHLGVAAITVGNASIDRAVILPETQNHLLYDTWEDIFYGAETPCDYQYGLTGTAVMLTGFAVGLPPLWNIESGRTGVGIFGLMDQGSNNGRGLIPAPPTAWTRYYAGWEEPDVVKPGDDVDVIRRDQGVPIRLNINDDEYFLIENRNNWVYSNVSIDSIRYAIYDNDPDLRYPPFVEVLFDSVQPGFDSTGVVVNIGNYDWGLPNSGLLIWHIDEGIILNGLDNFSVNADRKLKGVDLEEADGSQDIGQVNVFTFTDPTAGYFADMWYQGNVEYDAAHRSLNGYPLVFSPYTYPDTRSNSGAASHLIIQDIGYAADTMRISIASDLIAPGFPDESLGMRLIADLNDDGINDVVGGIDSLWWTSAADLTPLTFSAISDSSYQVFFTKGNNYSKALVLAEIIDDSIRVQVFEFSAINNFPELSWEQAIQRPDEYIICGDQIENTVRIEYPGGSYTISQTGIIAVVYDNAGQPLDYFSSVYRTPNSNSNYFVTLLEDGIQVDQATGSNIFRGHHGITDLALADLNLDGEADIIVIDSSGLLTVYDNNLYQMNGFPVDVSADGTVLLRDLIEDVHPEIVAQTSNGEITVINWQGEEQYHLANPASNTLQALADFNGRSAIITSYTIWQFDSLAVDDGNEWSRQNGNIYNDRTLYLSNSNASVTSSDLIDSKKTYCYPNPGYGDMIRIRTFIGNAQSLEITIFDIAGYQVDSFKVTDLAQQQIYEYEWDISDYESGLYFCRLVAEKGVKSETVVLKASVIN